MSDLWMQLDFVDQVMTWKNVGSHPVQPKTEVQSHWMKVALHDALWHDTHLQNDADCKRCQSLCNDMSDAKHAKVDLDEVAQQCEHLSAEQQREPLTLLCKHLKLFDNKLWRHLHARVHLEVEPGATPVHKCHHLAPRTHQWTFKKEPDHLASIRVLKPTRPSEWAAPTFAIPKKIGAVHWIGDFSL